jgi:hypothetical protein
MNSGSCILDKDVLYTQDLTTDLIGVVSTYQRNVIGQTRFMWYVTRPKDQGLLHTCVTSKPKHVIQSYNRIVQEATVNDILKLSI